jgi:dTDP-4-amino-4,6-dideoxy-D-galactose acyltransferase
MQTPSRCRLLDWDSEFFGIRIARAEDHRLTPQGIGAVLSWCREQAVACLYLLADAGDPLTVRLAQEHGFRLTDVRLTLAADLNASVGRNASSGGAIRPGRIDDIPRLREIAAGSFRDSRFYFDGRFPTDQCDRLYATWIEKSCRRDPEAVLVGESHGRAAGFLSCDIEVPSVGRIGLVAVDRAAQRQGLGGQLVRAALGWFAAQRLDRVVVTTQGRNIPAVRMYERSGFASQSIELWYHRWFLHPAREKAA